MPLRFQTVKELKPPLFGVSQMGEVARHSRVGGGKPPQSANADNRLLAVPSQL